MIFVVDVGPDATVLVDAGLGPGGGVFEVGDVGAEPGDVFAGLVVVPGLFEDLDVAGEGEHGGVHVVVHAVAADVVLAAAVGLDGGGGAGEALGVVVHELELELDHAADDVEVGFRADGETALDLELVVDGRIGAGVGADLEGAQDVAVVLYGKLAAMVFSTTDGAWCPSRSRQGRLRVRGQSRF